MIYTRYLYDKKDVEFSLLLSLLDKNTDETLFWGLELFYSGFKDELIMLIWRYYYELYAPFYINLEAHMLKYTKVWMENRLDDTYIATMLTNLSQRDACIDFYMMYRNSIESPKCLYEIFENIDRSNTADDIYCIATNAAIDLGLFKTRSNNALQNVKSIFETIQLPLKTLKSSMKSRLITGIFQMDENNHYDPKFYIIIKDCDISKYKTKPLIRLKGWKILLRECIYTIRMKPHTQDKNINQYDNWLYCASKTPIWKKRIVRYNGVVDETNQNIMFNNVDDEEEFFNMYNYEPDEQNKETQNKWLGLRPYESWSQIYEKHKCGPYNEWLSGNQ